MTAVRAFGIVVVCVSVAFQWLPMATADCGPSPRTILPPGARLLDLCQEINLPPMCGNFDTEVLCAATFNASTINPSTTQWCSWASIGVTNPPFVHCCTWNAAARACQVNNMTSGNTATATSALCNGKVRYSPDPNCDADQQFLFNTVFSSPSSAWSPSAGAGAHVQGTQAATQTGGNQWIPVNGNRSDFNNLSPSNSSSAAAALASTNENAKNGNATTNPYPGSFAYNGSDTQAIQYNGQGNGQIYNQGANLYNSNSGGNNNQYVPNSGQVNGSSSSSAYSVSSSQLADNPKYGNYMPNFAQSFITRKFLMRTPSSANKLSIISLKKYLDPINPTKFKNLVVTAFTAFDFDADGRMDRDEFAAAIKNQPVFESAYMSDTAITNYFAAADDNHDGFISFDEFSNVVIEIFQVMICTLDCTDSLCPMESCLTPTVENQKLVSQWNADTNLPALQVANQTAANLTNKGSVYVFNASSQQLSSVSNGSVVNSTSAANYSVDFGLNSNQSANASSVVNSTNVGSSNSSVNSNNSTAAIGSVANSTMNLNQNSSSNLSVQSSNQFTNGSSVNSTVASSNSSVANSAVYEADPNSQPDSPVSLLELAEAGTHRPVVANILSMDD